jgi:hypothetical protein
MEKLLSGDGIEVTGDLVRALVASQEEFRKRLGNREVVLLVRCFNNIDYGWSCVYRYHGINFHVESFLPLIPLLSFNLPYFLL